MTLQNRGVREIEVRPQTISDAGPRPDRYLLDKQTPSAVQGSQVRVERDFVRKLDELAVVESESTELAELEQTHGKLWQRTIGEVQMLDSHQVLSDVLIQFAHVKWREIKHRKFITARIFQVVIQVFPLGWE